MGSDIYTESAVAIKLEDFLNRKELKKKSVRNDIVDELIKTGFISVVDHRKMRESVSNFIEYFTANMSMQDGYEDDREHNDKALRVFCNHTGINMDADLVNFELRSFDNNREVGYDVDTDTIYLMFDSHRLFETKMTKEGKDLAKTLGLKEITETTWTIHSY